MAESLVENETILNLEYNSIKIAFEEARRCFRSEHRLFEKDLTSLLTSSVREGAVDADSAVRTQAKAELMLHKLSKISQDTSKARSRILNRMAAVRSVVECDSGQYLKDNQLKWKKAKVHRLISEYLLEKGLLRSALCFNSSAAGEFELDVDIFAEIQRLKAELRSSKATSCLAWCAENRSLLKKQESDLELLLRRQEFVELCRARDLKSAAEYARKYFQPILEGNRLEIEQALALMAIPATTSAYPYKILYSPQKWNDLAEQLEQDFRKLYSIDARSQMVSLVAAGLTALKTVKCGSSNDKDVNCPICVGPFEPVSAKLAYGHHENSILVCRITGNTMDADNPPMALPNGNVYSMKALQQMAGKTDGKVVCPRTGDVYAYKEARKCFIS